MNKRWGKAANVTVPTAEEGSPTLLLHQMRKDAVMCCKRSWRGLVPGRTGDSINPGVVPVGMGIYTLMFKSCYKL